MRSFCFSKECEFTCEPSLFVANGRGPSGAALGSQPTQLASDRNSVHNEEKIFPKLHTHQTCQESGPPVSGLRANKHDVSPELSPPGHWKMHFPNSAIKFEFGDSSNRQRQGVFSPSPPLSPWILAARKRFGPNSSPFSGVWSPLEAEFILGAATSHPKER